ncbi:nuclear body protein SP140-like protein isoform X1 [Saccopteryx leptura]|uniref:nuclear body protein SP140-like protein isoform X1 n=1 Tax=Saccopteryx leptura TaxID=249018 RepID=UPI00339C66EB
MTSGNSDRNTRMSAEDQKRLITETALNYFISQKLKISYAIKKPFPFFESLRDQKFITEEKYKDCQESCKNMTHLPHLVYSVLSELEKTFDIPVLKALFNEFNIREYPALTRIGKSFENVIHQQLCYQANDAEEREEDPNSQLSLEQGTDEDVSQNQDSSPADPSSPLGTAPRENGLSEELSETGQISVAREGASSDNNNESQEASEQGAQVSEPPGAPVAKSGIKINSCSVRLFRYKPVDMERGKASLSSGVKRQAHTACKHVSDPIVILSEDSAESGDGDETPEAFTSAVKRRPESTDSRIPPTSGKKLCKRKRSHEESPKPSANQAPPGARGSAVKTGPAGEGKDCGPRAPGQQESEFRAPVSLSAHTAPAAIPASISGTVNPGNNSTLEKAKKKRRSTNQETESVDFNSEILPVKCGKTDGSLYKNKLEQGATVKCIKSDDGNWFTPREFEIKGGREKSSNWKLSIRCGGETLKRLMDRGYLPKPPSKNNGKKKLRKSNTCEICRSRGTLFRCDTCSRSFHKGCHLPSVEKKSSPWSCTFCQIMLSAGSQQCRRESEVLARPMGPEEELKCKFLFLKVCCHFDENFPKKNQVATVRRVEALMMLKAIRKKLNERRYPQVEGFVRELRGVFQHSGAPANSNDVGLMKGRLEVKFEQNFKKVFAIQEIKEEPTDN